MARNDWPIVIGGCYRSGTSLVRRIVDAHSRIHCGPEITFFRDFYGHYRSDPIAHLRYSHSVRSILPEQDLLTILGRAFVEVHERAAACQGKKRWADKSPDNTRYADQWQALLGDEWLLVHVVRDPLDTLASMEAVRFPLTLPAELDERVGLFLELHRAGIRFGERHPERYFRIRYEALSRNPLSVISSLMRWLGDSLEPQQLAFNSVEHQRGLEDHKVHDTATVHAARIGVWHEILTEGQEEAIRRATEELWSQLASGLDV